MKQRLRLGAIGPMQRVDVTLRDLTVLVGPQATGKSIFLQLLKLMLDPGPIFSTLRSYGFDWGKDAGAFLDLYFGEGTREIWNARSSLDWNGKQIKPAEWVRPRKLAQEERCFYVPAQRVLALSRDGWLRPFADYKAGDPFSIRDFSEKLRRLMETGFGTGDTVFPQNRRMKSEIREMVASAIFAGLRLELLKDGSQKRLVLADPQHALRLPYMVWSAGQREFVPLLLGLYWLLPATRVQRRDQVEWVLIEEPEMGLHPQGVQTVLLIVLELLWRGYKVVLSTHSPQVLDLVWALGKLRECAAEPGEVLRLFGATPTPATRAMAKEALSKSTSVYYFDRETGGAEEISSLDPAAANPAQAGWGGLTAWSGRTAEVVADAVNRCGRT